MRTVSVEDRLAMLESRVADLEALRKEIPVSAELDGERARCLRHVQSLREWVAKVSAPNIGCDALFEALVVTEDGIRSGREKAFVWTFKKS